MILLKRIELSLLILVVLSGFKIISAQQSKGVWINLEYQKELERTHSPLKAHESLTNYISHITIGDLPDIVLGMNFHDSIDLKRNGSKLFSEKGDTLFELRMNNGNLVIKNLRSLAETEMIRVSDDTSDPWQSIVLYVIPLTIAGTYTDIYTQKGVVFKQNGDVDGLEGITGFEVGLDCSKSVKYDYFKVYPTLANKPFLGWDYSLGKLEIFEFMSRKVKTDKKKTIFRLKRI